MSQSDDEDPPEDPPEEISDEEGCPEYDVSDESTA